MKDIFALEAITFVREEYRLPCEKPCIAVLLDGNLSGDRHVAAFTIAQEWRRLGVSRKDAARGLDVWGRKVGYGPAQIQSALRSAYSGRWHPPGLKKKGRYAELLQPTCDLVGCPDNCPAYSSVHRGARGETFRRFGELGWPELLKKKRRYAAIEVYRALCNIEKEREWLPGAPLRVTYELIAGKASVAKSTVGKSLDVLVAHELIAFERGGGSGPKSRDRHASLVQRRVPIPAPSAVLTTAIRTGSQRQPYIGSQRKQENRPDLRVIRDENEAA